MTTEDAEELYVIFDSLPFPASTTSTLKFATRIIPAFTNHRIAKSPTGNPVLLIKSAEREAGSALPIRLENLEVLHNAECEVTDDAETTLSVFTVVVCRSTDRSIQRYFVGVCSELVRAVGDNPLPGAVNTVLAGFVKLFRALTEAPRKPVQGLWAELFVLSECRDPSVLANAWRVDPSDRFDFNRGNERLEIKSAMGRDREHFFSFEQLHPPANTEVLVGSVLIERAGAGVSAADLARTIKRRIPFEAHLRLELVIAQTLGSSLVDGLKQRFDADLARESLLFFSSHEVPTVLTPLPEGISEVHFKANLARCRPLREGDLTGLLARAAWPSRDVQIPPSVRN